MLGTNSVYVILMLFVCLYYVQLRSTNQKVLVVMYETNVNDPHVKSYIKTLKKHNYEYKVITDSKWEGFGKKIKTLETFLNTLSPEKVVIISDARDVFVSRDSKTLLSTYESMAKNKILVSTELACCESSRVAKGPNSFRHLNGTHYDANMHHSQSTTKPTTNQIATWVTAFKDFVESADPDTNLQKWKWTNPNAGLYMGKVKHILELYRYMNIYENHEDDQSILSEIILQNKNKFVLDIYSNVFSSSFPWDPSSTELYGGCYYEKDSSSREGNVRNKIFKTNPFFLHFPGKHFSCYDKVIRHA